MMATRNVKIKECDRLGCRRRKGVRNIKVATTTDERAKANLCAENGWEGDLCPYHIEQLLSKITAMFDNTKPADPEDS